MIYDNIKFHNVEAMVPAEGGGMRLSRFPLEIGEGMDSDNARGMMFFSSGVELRFRMKSPEVKVWLSLPDQTEGMPASIWFGGFQGNWFQSLRILHSKKTCVTVTVPDTIEKLRHIAAEKQMDYHPDMVRIRLPYGACVYHGVEGDVMPPLPGDEPARTLLTYGSSITHGSLALGAPHTYASLLGERLHCDVINLGLAGACHLEDAVMTYIAGRKDWNILTMEIGINMVSCFDEDAFRARVHHAVERMAADSRPVFTSSIVRCIGESEKYDTFRRIAAEQTAGKLDHINGLELLDDVSMMAADEVHPSAAGHQLMASRWADHILRTEAGRRIAAHT